MRIPIITSEVEVVATLQDDRYAVISCLNGFTLRELINNNAYDSALEKQHIAFVADGVLAHRHIEKRARITAQRICGRDLLTLALSNLQHPVHVIGGMAGEEKSIQSLISERWGRCVTISSPPLLRDVDETKLYARIVAPEIAEHSLVVVFLRSPIQDTLASELALLTKSTKFLCIGAVLDDIRADRTTALSLYSRLRLEWLYRLVANPRRTIPKLLGSLTSVNTDKLQRYKFTRV